MSLADRFRSMLNKKSDPASPKELKPEPPVTPKKSPPMEERGRLIAQEKTEGESKLRALEKELEGIRGSLEKIEVTAKCSRETQGQTLQYLQQDAEREIKFFERKLREDMKHWDQQLKDREKALQQSLLQVETGQLEMKSASEKSDVGAREAAARTESLLKEQETKLLENRQRWRDLLQAKENELVTVKQELARRET